MMMVTGTEGQGLPIAIGGEPTAQIAFVFPDLGSKLEREQAPGIDSRFWRLFRKRHRAADGKRRRRFGCGFFGLRAADRQGVLAFENRPIALIVHARERTRIDPD